MQRPYFVQAHWTSPDFYNWRFVPEILSAEYYDDDSRIVYQVPLDQFGTRKYRATWLRDLRQKRWFEDKCEVGYLRLLEWVLPSWMYEAGEPIDVVSILSGITRGETS